MINYGRQFIDQKDINEVTKVLKSSFLTQGTKVEQFEKKLLSKFNAKYCTVASSGTAALHLLGSALEWKKGDIILTTPISFLATSNCILYSNAKPVFVDIEKNSYTVDVNLLEKKIIQLKKKKNKIKAIICTDFAGHPCDWKSLKRISKKYKIVLINDNCHAFGASIDGSTNYALKYADYISLSFHAVKHITTGEGGAILSNNKLTDSKIKILRSHGVVRKKANAPWFYEMKYLGYNYRLTDFQSVLGISQLRKLPKFISRRKKIAKIYDEQFYNIKNVFIPKIKKGMGHAYHLYPLCINFSKFKISKEIFFKKLKKLKINLQVHYIPIHLQPFYKKKFKTKTGDFPISEKFYKEEVSLPIFYNLSNKNVLKVVKSIKKILKIND